jgi:FMN-dependent NADH-azoreductase
MQAADMLTPYLTSVFRFMGFEDIRAVTAGSTAYPPEVSGPSVGRSLDHARSAGTAF